MVQRACRALCREEKEATRWIRWGVASRRIGDVLRRAVEINQRLNSTIDQWVNRFETRQAGWSNLGLRDYGESRCF